MKPQDHKKTEEILGSLDGLKRATAPDFFYTRLRARMEKELGKEPNATRRPWVLRPVYAVIALLIVLLLNAAVIFQGNAGEDTAVASEADTYQTIAAEYSINDIVFEEVYK